MDHAITSHHRYGISANKGKPGGQLRWCSSCAKAHAEAELLHRGLQCEDCGQVSANYRMPDDSRERWCAGCARKSHPEALVFEAQRKAKKWAAAYKCETCKAVAPSHGLRMEGKARWCEGCASAHNGAVHLGRCEVSLPAQRRRSHFHPWASVINAVQTKLPLPRKVRGERGTEPLNL